MENQGTRDDATGRSKPVGTFAGAASPNDATAVGEPVDAVPGAGGTSGLGARTASFGDQEGAHALHGQATGHGSDAVGGAMGKVDAGIERAAGGIDKLVGAVRDKGEELGHSSGAAGTVGSVATAAADRLEGASHYLHQTDTERLMSDLESLIRRRPVESMLAAAGIGFVLAKALR